MGFNEQEINPLGVRINEFSREFLLGFRYKDLYDYGGQNDFDLSQIAKVCLNNHQSYSVSKKIILILAKVTPYYSRRF